MSVDLHDLEIASQPELPENIDQILQQIPLIVERVRWSVEHCKGSVRLFENAWRRLMATVAEGRTAEVQAARDQFRRAVDDRLGLLMHTRDRANLLRSLGMTGIPDPKEIEPDLSGMEEFKRRTCDRWRTSEDLEDLVARDYPLTTDDLDRIAPNRRPPPTWHSEAGPAAPAAPVAFRRRGHPIIAWIVIVLAVAVILFGQQYRAREFQGAAAAHRAPTFVMDMQGRYLVGLNELLPAANRQDISRQAAVLNAGPVGQRLRYVVLVGELDGPQQALKQLDELQAGGAKLTADQERLCNILHRLYADYSIGMVEPLSVSDQDRAWFREKLGWWADLALAPKSTPDTAARQTVLAPARRTAIVLLGMVTTVFSFGMLGAAGLLLVGTMLLTGKLRRHFQTGSAAGGIYAETFAVWMIVYMALLGTVSMLPLGQFHFLAMGGAMVVSLIALVWPVLRGLSWRQVREEIGWTAGSRPLLEPLYGVGTYLMGLPILMVGVLLTLLLIKLQAWMKTAGGQPPSPEDLPVHPIGEEVVRLGWWGRAQVLFLASILAPLVEETLFRGVLYRHLREATSRWAWPVAVFASATVVSFVFAVIHPQGLAAVPALMALAYSFTIAREWRGTLIPAMVAHGINNGIVFTVILLLT